MSLAGVKRYLAAYGLADKVIELDASSATVKDAATALSTKEDRIAKTLSFLLDETPIIVVVSGNAKVDNHKFKETFHKKAKMIPFADVERITSHPVGGVCPFDLPDGIAVFLDKSLAKYETVFPACGSANSAIELTIAELEKAAHPAAWVDVTVMPEASE